MFGEKLTLAVPLAFYVLASRGNPSLSIDDVYHCVDEMYGDDASKDIDNRISNAYVSKCVAFPAI